MNTTIDPIDAHRFAKVNFADHIGAKAQPAGCKGAACPAFAICQGRCASRQERHQPHPDGGVWIETRG
jgi:radical SAM protein with 4Fe4S-binding SPASM domain